jgi:CIC family chloride channel protein
VLKGLRWFDSVEGRSARLAPFMPLLVLGTLGVASIWLPQLLGNGYAAADAALHGELALSLLVTLPVLRFGATAACTAGQIPGGLFTPVLSIGALVGGLVGAIVSHVWPGAPTGAFALLGMGALLAGTSRGPISSVVMLAELSSDYALILPLACACGAATLVSRSLERGSLYRLGPRCRPPAVPPPAAHIPLHPARTAPALTCAADLLPELLALDARPLYVVDACGRLEGALQPETVRRRLSSEVLPRLLIVHDLVDRDCPRLSVRASQDEARALFTGHDAPRFVPVVDDDGFLLGEACRDDHVDELRSPT